MSTATPQTGMTVVPSIRELDRLSLEVPTHVGTSYDTSLPGHHKAENDLSAS